MRASQALQVGAERRGTARRGAGRGGAVQPAREPGTLRGRGPAAGPERRPRRLQPGGASGQGLSSPRAGAAG